MPDSIADFLHNARPTAERPLMGHTILLVEDSRFASEAMRLLCLRSGARIRRADSLRAAGRHLRAYHPSVVIVDLGLPDGSGLDLIAELAAPSARALVILATSGDVSLVDAARAAGADGFLAKPITSLAQFQEAVLSRLPDAARPTGLRALPDEHVRPDRLALRDDLEHILNLLGGAQDAGTLRYASRFLAGLARSAEDAELAAAAEAFAGRDGDGEGDPVRIGRLTGLVEDRLRRRAVV
ncbi:response regulator [Palleronia sp. KMU-117]|uniref:response regulator n=1 Tax=Palleronia sp. KMU-117 TaxID=3434108 RepID=UPI003D75784C